LFFFGQIIYELYNGICVIVITFCSVIARLPTLPLPQIKSGVARNDKKREFFSVLPRKYAGRDNYELIYAGWIPLLRDEACDYQ